MRIKMMRFRVLRDCLIAVNVRLLAFEEPISYMYTTN
jgi:hypothetical protein